MHNDFDWLAGMREHLVNGRVGIAHVNDYGNWDFAAIASCLEKAFC